MATKHAYGWKHSLPDQRDLEFTPAAAPVSLPTHVDLRVKDSPIYDQGQLGSCVANGTGSIWEFALRAENKPAPLPARLFIYYNGRVIEGTVNEDSGLTVRDGLKVLSQMGCCDESLVPYDISKFTVKPPASAYTAAKAHQATQYLAVKQDLPTMKACLAAGFPIAIGFTVYDSFESNAVAQTGHAPMPGKNESVLGGHCVAIVGYDDVKRVFIVRNSWGTGWGDKGYCYFPYSYLTNPKLASDFWTVRAVN